ncbi:MAG: DNA/RNA nuclease SfsA [Dehalococcoidia bacterium]|nr:DNA/RNA nuclease SfsA [Dehalococcoidia bacterium]
MHSVARARAWCYDTSTLRGLRAMVLLPSPLQKAVLSHRLNRFAVLAEVNGQSVTAHLPNSGRLRELLQPGNLVFLAPKTGPRKTPFDMVLVEAEGRLVSCDAHLPPAVLAEAIRQGQAPPFAKYETVRREVTFGESRLDLLLTEHRGRCFIEAKSVTLVENDVALFPDAPTERGRRHLGSRHQDHLDAFLRQPAELLRQELLSIHGIGKETADDILLYAAGYPFFVVDAYTRRIFERLGITPQGLTYQDWQDLLHGALPREAPLFNEYHALQVAHGKATCRKTPLCEGCCLLDICPAGQTRAGGRREQGSTPP